MKKTQRPTRTLFAICLAEGLVRASIASAAPEGYSYNLPLALAVEAAAEAVRSCESSGYHVTATVVDMAGTPKVVLRGDGATVHTGESSFRKAFTVVTLGPEFGFEASSGFYAMQKSNPFASQLATVHNVMALPGAVALTSQGTMIAALGVGGAPGGDKDEVCAHSGVDKVKDRLPQ